MTDIWQRQPRETPAQFRAFRAYLDLGEERSIKAACGRPSSVSRWESWSAANSWVARARAYDQHRSELGMREAHCRRRELVLRAIDLEVKSQDVAERLVDALYERLVALLEGPCPLQTFERKTILPTGETVVESQTSVISDLCRLSAEYRHALSLAVNGPLSPEGRERIEAAYRAAGLRAEV